MNKKISLYLLILGGVSQSIYGPTASKSVTQQDTTFPSVFFNTNTFTESPFTKRLETYQDKDFFPALLAWDLNKVVFAQESFTNQVAWARQTFGILETIDLFYKSMALLKQKSTLKKAGNVRGGCWAAVIDTIQDKKLKEQLIQATIHANKPHYPVITLMQELNSLGNSNRVLSNMGEPVIQAQKAHIHSLISAITTVDTLETAEIAEDIATTIQAPVTVTLEDEQLKSLKFLENFLTQPTNVATGQNGDWTAKPSPKIYQRFLKENSSQTNPNQLKIFIDDKKKNVLAAIESGFDIGIIFTTPEALREILFMLGQTEITYKNTTIKSNNLLPRS